MNKTSVGRIVHFQNVIEGSVDAAIVTAVHADGYTVDLTIFGPGDTRYGHAIKFDDVQKRPGTWHWPERT